MRRAVLYLRVSTVEQTTDNQQCELLAVAERMNCNVVHVYTDHGISGAKGRDKRPAFDQMCKAATKREFDLVMAWSVDRLGRSLQHLVAFLGELHATGRDLYLHQQHLDTSTPSGRAMFQMLGVFAELERSMIAERVRSGLARAKGAGTRLGRPPVPKAKRERVIEALNARTDTGEGVRRIAMRMGVSVASVQRIASANARPFADEVRALV
jgi:DNA invertase Pin-like site-specific DNA recombinase